MENFKITKLEKMFQVLQLCEMADEIWNEHFTPIIGKAQVDYMLDKFQSPHAIREQLEHGYEYYIFSIDDTDVGYMGINPEEDKLFLSKLYVKKASRKQGIAHRAIDYLCDLCRERELHSIWLTVNKHNDNTIAAYHKLGFSVVREQETDIGGDFVMDDYVMEKPVA